MDNLIIRVEEYLKSKEVIGVQDIRVLAQELARMVQDEINALSRSFEDRLTAVENKSSIYLADVGALRHIVNLDHPPALGVPTMSQP